MTSVLYTSVIDFAIIGMYLQDVSTWATQQDGYIYLKTDVGYQPWSRLQVRLSERTAIMSDKICDNCGAGEGLHHWETMQCPVGGMEAPIGRKQEWAETRFDTSASAVRALRKTIADRDARIKALEAEKERVFAILSDLQYQLELTPGGYYIYRFSEYAMDEFRGIFKEQLDRAVGALLQKGGGNG